MRIKSNQEPKAISDPKKIMQNLQIRYNICFSLNLQARGHHQKEQMCNGPNQQNAEKCLTRINARQTFKRIH